MRIYKHMAQAATVALCALAMASCNDGNEDYKLTQTLPGCINWSTTMSDENVFVSENVSYRVNTNYTTQKCEIIIENLALPTGQRFTSLTLKDLPYTVKDDAWRVIDAKNVFPESSALATSFSDFKFVMADRFIGSSYYPALSISYVVGGVKLYSTLSMLACRGTTEVTAPDGSTYTQDENSQAVYMIALDPKKMTATLAIEGAKFANSMPALNMEFRDIPFQFTSDGKVKMDEDALATPYVIGSNGTATPFEGATITDFECEADGSNYMKLTFTCAMRMGEAPMPIVYKVKVDCAGF